MEIPPICDSILRRGTETNSPALLRAPNSKQKQSTLDTYKSVSKMPKSGNHWKDIARSLCEFVDKDMQPMAIVEGEGFKRFMSVVQPAYEVPS